MTGPGTGTVRESSVLENASAKVWVPFWLTTMRPKVNSLRSGLTSQIRRPIASFPRGPSQAPMNTSAS